MRLGLQRLLAIAAAMAWAWGGGLLDAAPPAYQPPQPTQAVEIVRYTWHDDARNRDVPVKIYYPAKGSGPFPVIIFSHGLGGSRENYEYLGRYWAGCGYVSVHLQHLGSDDSVWKGVPPALIAVSMRKAVTDISNAINRAGDVPFAIDQVIKLNTAKDSPLFGKLDTADIGMAGHSFGGWSTMAAAGELLGPDQLSMGDSRIKAGIPMSAPVPPVGERDHAFDKITMPLFYMTGTLDNSPIGETKASERRILYDKTNHAETCLVIFTGADHMVFSGRLIRNALDESVQSLVCTSSVAFWDAYLRNNKSAKDWLYNGGFTALLGDKGTFEKKMP